MSLDTLARRGFPLVMGTLIATAAYYQASGISHILGTTIAPEVSDFATLAPHVAPSQLPDDPHTKSAAAILSRNPFDSATGPLDGTALKIPELPAVEVDHGDPYDDPPCDAGRVLLITASENPDWSFAAIEEPGGRSVLRRRGSEVAGKTVDFIGWDRVWLMSNGTRCQLQLGSELNKKVAVRPAKRPTRTARRNRNAVPKEIAERIHKVSATEFNVDRSAIDLILEQQAVLMRSARITPEKRDGKVVGMKLRRVRAGSLLDTLGLKNGDTLRSINGFDMTDPTKALEAYTRLRSADRLSVAVDRGGKPMTLDFNIR